ncbi:hypothetical protein BD414DRAFT_488233 [Trametes punicea]|nr:hypothetical protein BD414DRAFT_488233 [Trametes punicea]
MSFFMVNNATSWHSAVISAPEQPSVILAISSRSRSGSTVIFPSWIRRISNLPSKSAVRHASQSPWPQELSVLRYQLNRGCCRPSRGRRLAVKPIAAVCLDIGRQKPQLLIPVRTRISARSCAGGSKPRGEAAWPQARKLRRRMKKSGLMTETFERVNAGNWRRSVQIGRCLL